MNTRVMILQNDCNAATALQRYSAFYAYIRLVYLDVGQFNAGFSALPEIVPF